MVPNVLALASGFYLVVLLLPELELHGWYPNLAQIRPPFDRWEIKCMLSVLCIANCTVFKIGQRDMSRHRNPWMTLLATVPREHQLAKSNIGLSSPPDSDRSLPTRWMPSEAAGVSAPRCPGWPAGR